MKKHILFAIIAITALTGNSVLAASTISLTPENINVYERQSFDVMIAVISPKTDDYTVRVELNYPADLLEISSFNFVNDWIPLNDDLIDNAKGVLIKSAKYPDNVSSTAIFGIVSFTAKKTGSGVIKLGDNSIVLDSNNQNVLSETSEVSFKIDPVPALVGTDQPTSSEEEPLPVQNNEKSQSSLPWPGIIITIVAISLAAYFLLKKKS